jgi:hypothetical protein
MLQGRGSRVRQIVLGKATDIKSPPIEALIKVALAAAAKPIDASRKRHLIIESVSAKQRARCPT